MAEVKWIKIATNIFDNRKIKMIEMLPDGDSLIVIWVKLLCLAGNINDSGYIYFTKELPYTDQMLSVQFGRPLTTIQLALNTFIQYEMIEVVDDIYKISNWERYQNTDRLQEIREYNRLAKQRSRERQKLLVDVNDMSMTSQPSHATDIDKNKSKKKKKIVDKITFGEFQHVKLTQEEYDRLADKYGTEIRDLAIDFFDKYLEEKPNYKSASHNLAIQRWVIDAVKEKRQKAQGSKNPGFNKMENTNNYDFGELEKQLRSN